MFWIIVILVIVFLSWLFEDRNSHKSAHGYTKEVERKREEEHQKYLDTIKEIRLAEEARLEKKARLAEEARCARVARLAEEARFARVARLEEEKRLAEKTKKSEENQSLEKIDILIDSKDWSATPSESVSLSKPGEYDNQRIINEGDIEVEINDTDYVSTTKLGNIYGIKARPELFEFFIKEGFLIFNKKNKQYELTKQGKNFGGYCTTKDDNSKFVVWHLKKIEPFLNKYIKQKSFNFGQFYHLTHIKNLEGIFANGLYCHSAKHDYIDISNTDVNQRRDKIENCHGKKIHDYVPFYFNVKNAMLYAVQKNIGKNVVIIEMEKMAAFLPYTIFSDRNAAVSNAKITHLKEDLKTFNWGQIHSDSWIDNNIKNITRMQLMMAECLILDKVPTIFIKTIESVNNSV